LALFEAWFKWSRELLLRENAQERRTTSDAEDAAGFLSISPLRYAAAAALERQRG